MDQYNTKPSNASYPTTKNARGVTLVELIISMLIISIALAGVLSVMNFTTGRSADPMIQHQAIAIAEAYMEEILLQGYFDPNIPNPEVGSDECPTKESDRRNFDNVCDYNGLSDDGARKITEPDIVIPGLGKYGVSVDVIYGDDMLNNDPALKITVTVVHDAMGEIDLVGYRTRY
jgi:MSHA pilin protein MshD